MEYQLNHIEQQRADDFQWAKTAPDVQRHRGNFVVVHNRQVVAFGTDRIATVAEAAAKEKCSEDDLVVVVVLPDELWESPH